MVGRPWIKCKKCPPRAISIAVAFAGGAPDSGVTIIRHSAVTNQLLEADRMPLLSLSFFFLPFPSLSASPVQEAVRTGGDGEGARKERGVGGRRADGTRIVCKRSLRFALVF